MADTSKILLIGENPQTAKGITKTLSQAGRSIRNAVEKLSRIRKKPIKKKSASLIRVLLVEDSILTLGFHKKMLNSSPEIEGVVIALTEKQAIDLAIVQYVMTLARIIHEFRYKVSKSLKIKKIGK